MLLVVLVGNGVEVGFGGHGLVEGGVEDEYLGQFGQHLLHGDVALEVGFGVERGEFHVLLPLFEHLVGHHHALGEASAGHDAVARCGDFVEALDGTVFGMEEGVEHELDALGVGGAGRLDDFRFAVDLGLEEGAFEANLLDAAGSEDAPGVHFVEFVLDGGAAAVDY